MVIREAGTVHPQQANAPYTIGTLASSGCVVTAGRVPPDGRTPFPMLPSPAANPADERPWRATLPPAAQRARAALLPAATLAPRPPDRRAARGARPETAPFRGSPPLSLRSPAGRAPSLPHRPYRSPRGKTAERKHQLLDKLAKRCARDTRRRG